MKKLLIFSILTIPIMPAICFAQNKGDVSGNSKQATVAVINAPPNEVPAVTNPPMPASVVCTTVAASTEYQVGTDDVLHISVLQPEKLFITATVSPDGSITFPYIGTVPVRGKTLSQIQDDVQKRLSDGYMKYPVVSVALVESNSRRFFVYGEVVRAGSYNMEENMTVLRAISMAGGFSQFGSASRVKILRPKRGEGGYDVIKVNITDVMNGVSDADPAINQGDIIVVSEGIF